MILVDTSVWIDHLVKAEEQLLVFLKERSVVTHPFIIEELACGHLPHRSEMIDFLKLLPKATQASHFEILDFISRHSLYGTGLQAVDMHLLASACLTGINIWSRDKILCRTAKHLHVLAPHT